MSTVDRDDALLVSSLNEILNQHEFCIIYTIYFLGYSSADIAQSSGTSRQAVNQTKRRALEKLRKAFVV
ncbi:MAG: sigma factor-like helix-turn-helix DNA-binding protein [Thermotaleaceae bacterium]